MNRVLKWVGLISSSTHQQQPPVMITQQPLHPQQRTGTVPMETNQVEPPDSSQFGNALETMDRFLMKNESNLIVQFLVSLEARTNISRCYLARGLLVLLVVYFLFSSSVLDMITHLLMYFYPSYRSYLLLKQSEHLTKEDLQGLLKYWIFIGFYSTVDYFFVISLPFSSLFKLVFIVQCVLPQKSPAVDLVYQHVVCPLFHRLSQSDHIEIINTYLRTLSTDFQTNHDHTD